MPTPQEDEEARAEAYREQLVRRRLFRTQMALALRPASQAAYQALIGNWKPIIDFNREALANDNANALDYPEYEPGRGGWKRLSGQ